MQKLWKHPECETARIACYQSETHDKKLLKKTAKNIIGQSHVIKLKLIITKHLRNHSRKTLNIMCGPTFYLVKYNPTSQSPLNKKLGTESPSDIQGDSCFKILHRGALGKSLLSSYVGRLKIVLTLGKFKIETASKGFKLERDVLETKVVCVG
jgi:hypothetical protein